MKNLILAFSMGFLAINCGRSSDNTTLKPDQLPAITQTGANTAGCLINGRLLIPKNGEQSIGGQPLFGLTASFHYDGYYCIIENYKELRYIYFYVQNIKKGVGDYTINQSVGTDTPTGTTNITQMYINDNGKIYLSSDNAGVITIYNSNPIISGTFKANLYNKDNPADKISITDGRFDINTATLNK